MITTIEVADREYWKHLKYADALLYVSMLSIDGKNDWRLLEDFKEYTNIFGSYDCGQYWYGNNLNDKINHHSWRYVRHAELLTIPIRG